MVLKYPMNLLLHIIHLELPRNNLTFFHLCSMTKSRKKGLNEI